MPQCSMFTVSCGKVRKNKHDELISKLRDLIIISRCAVYFESLDRQRFDVGEYSPLRSFEKTHKPQCSNVVNTVVLASAL